MAKGSKAKAETVELWAVIHPRGFYEGVYQNLMAAKHWAGFCDGTIVPGTFTPTPPKPKKPKRKTPSSFLERVVKKEKKK